MFTTFFGTSPLDATHKGKPGTRPKRSQVPRACDWCRLTRAKCESSRPCHNCKQTQRRCSTDGQNDFRSIAAATKEVERLRAQVRDLESRLQLRQPTPPALPPPAAAASHARAHAWRGVRVHGVSYGPASLSFFLRRMYTFLAATLQAPQPALAPPADMGVAGLLPPALDDSLQRPQQDYFLDLYWQAYHLVHPIINEAEFRDHYRSLWPDGDSSPAAFRQPSPLVDIVLALCVQFGSSFIPRLDADDAPASPGHAEAPLAGYFYYQRCQAVIDYALEAPSLAAVQCGILSTVYLLNAGLVSTAQAMCAKAIRIAITLGLNHEPEPSEPEPEKELMRRIWWSLYILDTQMSLELGQPWLIQSWQSTCNMPAESDEVAMALGPSFVSPEPDVSWLTLQGQTLRLVNAVRDICTAFYDKYDQVLGAMGAEDFYENGEAREDCARFLAEQVKQLTAWQQQVPAGLKTPRRTGEAFSADRTPLMLSDPIPLWLQRQRLLLELQFHNFFVNLHRPFICFSPTPAASTPLSDSSAITCLRHAITFTNIVHQVLTETDCLNGWYQIFQWQQNVAFVLLGYACAYPVCPPTPAARKAIAAAISVFEVFESNFTAARTAANITRQLSNTAGIVIDRFRSGLAGSSPRSGAGSTQASTNSDPSQTDSEPSESTPPTEVSPTELAAMNTVTEMGSLWLGMDAAVSPGLWAVYMKEYDMSTDEQAPVAMIGALGD